jgi:sugar lactone lactonase YvrE
LKIITSKPECVWKLKSLLGEGTVWVKSLNSIFFVDIKKKKIFILNTKNRKKKIIKVNKEIGFLSQVKKSIFILGLKGELRIVDLKTKKKIKSIIVEKDKPLNRLNDGKTDPRGRLWFGSMDNLERNVESGSLYCLDNNFKLTKVDSNYMITNGPAFIDTKNFFHTDSRKKIIYKIKIDNNLNIKRKKIFKKFSKFDGSPDGMTIDKLKNLWVCHFGGACISVFNKKGKKIHKIDLPAKNVTNCTFGGKNNTDLFISTARKSMNKTDLQKFKFSGSLFKVKTNIKGKATRPFKLS